MSSYCSYAPGQPYHDEYHEREYGFPLDGDEALFGRLILEINQAGLSWLTILKKKDAFHEAYDAYDIGRIAAYGEADRARLLGDARIVRNRLKVDAAIENARRIQALQAEFGSFRGWLEAHHPLDRDAWTRLFRRTFRFTGGEIVNEFLVSTGYLPGAHRDDCPVQARVRALRPPWLRGSKTDGAGFPSAPS